MYDWLSSMGAVIALIGAAMILYGFSDLAKFFVRAFTSSERMALRVDGTLAPFRISQFYDQLGQAINGVRYIAFGLMVQVGGFALIAVDTLVSV